MRQTEPEADTPDLDKQLNLFDTVNIIVGIVIGTTIFALPWLIFLNTPNVWMALAVWVLGGVLALIGGLCYAELASTYPRAGGDYYYLTAAFGRWVGFLFGWAQLIVILPASIGVMAYVFATESTQLHRMDDFLKLGLSSEFYYAAIAVLGITFLNLIGVVFGKTVQNVLALAKVAGLLAILACGFMHAQPEATDWTFPEWGGGGWGWQSLALILVLYAYGGWNDAAFVAAEVRDPQRNIPRALIFGIGSITLIYLLVNFAYILGLGFGEAKAFGPPDFRTPPTKLLLAVMGENGAKMMRIIIMISALGAVNGLIFAGSRVYAVLGNDHRLFGFVGHWRPNRGSPILALIFQAAITLALVLLFGTERGHTAINHGLDALNNVFATLAEKFDATAPHIEYSTQWKPGDAFEALVSHSAPAFWIFFMLAGFSLFALREKNPGKARPFSVPWYPLLPFIFCNMCAYMLYQSIDYIGWRSLFVVALLLLGVPLYWLSQAFGGRRDTDIDYGGNR
ncbi:MAG: amino acid permease [Gemmataceae bacterium]